MAAVIALARAGREGAEAVSKIAENHPNEAVRVFAGLALGKAPEEKH